MPFAGDAATLRSAVVARTRFSGHQHPPGPRSASGGGVADDVPGLGQAPDDARILIMTHSHALDFAIALAALAAGRFAYVGVIGSQTKRARFLSQMRQAGLDEQRIARLTCPIGIHGIEGKEPAVIAASVVAQILLLPVHAAAGAGREESRLPAERRSVGGKSVS